jgi:peroxiredoxin (alkyl hydroperoxide reductase subunit C)
MAWYNGFKKIRLSDYQGKYVVLFFYPLDFTFVCPTEIVQFSDRVNEFRALNCEVLGASIDSQFSHMEYTKKDRKKGGLGKMEIPLIADVTKNIARTYGCLIENGSDAGVALRATYIIDKTGTIKHISMNDLPVGRNIDEVLRLVKAFQYVEEFGEVCPAQWQPGAKTMHADPTSQKTEQYWEQEHGK